MKHIQTITVGAGGAANIEFTSIPQTYTDLILKISVRSDESGGSAQSTSLFLNINGVNTNRTFRSLNAISGTTAESISGTTAAIGTIPGTSVTTSTFNNTEVYFANYTSSNNKSFSVDSVTENNSSTNNNLRLTAGLWSSSSAITSLTIVSATGNIVQYSSASLYGIKNS